MQNIVLTFIFLMSVSAHAATEVVIKGRNSAVLYRESREDIGAFANIGELTVSALRASGLTFSGDVNGIEAIDGLAPYNELPSGVEAKIYGWCFSIDDIVPDTMPNDTPVPATLRKLTWFFAYAHYLNGDWRGYCVPHGTRDRL